MRTLRSVLGSPFASALLASLLTAAVLGGGGVAEAFNVPNNSVTSAKVVDNSLNNRDLAIGQRTFPVRHRSGDVTNRVFATVNGLQFRVSCSADGEERLDVRKTSATSSEISFTSLDANANDGAFRGAIDDQFVRNEVFPMPISGSAATDRNYTVHYVTANGNNVTAHLVTEDDLGPNDCIVGGYIVG